MNIEQRIEELAAVEHDQWSDWMKYLFSKCSELPESQGDGLVLPGWAVRRWTKQMNTPYEQLSEEEKQSDRDEVQRYMPIIKSLIGEILDELELEKQTLVVPEDKPDYEGIDAEAEGWNKALEELHTKIAAIKKELT